MELLGFDAGGELRQWIEGLVSETLTNLQPPLMDSVVYAVNSLHNHRRETLANERESCATLEMEGSWMPKTVSG